jgi:hypothetical protein
MRSQSSVPATKARPRGCRNSSWPPAKIGARAAERAAPTAMSRPDSWVRDHLLTQTVRQIGRSRETNTGACSEAGLKPAIEAHSACAGEVDFGRQLKLRSISKLQSVRIRRWAPLHAQLRPQPHLSQLRRSHHGALMPKPNYHQARKQKELARKARQQEKQQRRSARPDDPGATPPAGVDALRESTPETAK